MDFKARYQYNPKSDLLGKGGFAIVYKANDNLLNRTVALKFFTVTNIHNNTLIKEISRAIVLNHPNLCRYFDAALLESTNMHGETERIEVGVMEYIDGGELKQYHNQNPNHLNKLLIDILQGLSYLHSNSIIHRDLKPQNILIKNMPYGPMAKITDFGISKILNGENTKSQLMGTVEYMAPEQFSPVKYGINGRIGTNLDLWSFGLLVYELIEGKTLFGGDGNTSSAEQIMSNILNQELAEEKFKKLPEPYRKLVRLCLVKDAKLRAQTADELINVLKSNGEKTSKHADKAVAAKAKAFPSQVDEPIAVPNAQSKSQETQKAPDEIKATPTAQGETLIFPNTQNKAAGTPAAQGETLISSNTQGETRVLPNIHGETAVTSGTGSETVILPKSQSFNNDVSSTIAIEKRPESRDDLYSKVKNNGRKENGSSTNPIALTKKRGLVLPLILLIIAIVGSAAFLIFSKGKDNNVATNKKHDVVSVNDKNADSFSGTLPDMIKAANSGDDSAKYKLAKYYYDKGEFANAETVIQPLALKNQPEALKLLGKSQYEAALILYYQNDFTHAFQLFNKASATNNAKAQCMLGTMYFKGQGVPKSDIEALEWYLKSSDQKNEVAMFMLGYFYAEGIAVKQSRHSAEKFLKWEVDNGKDKPTRDAAVQKLASLNQ